MYDLDFLSVYIILTITSMNSKGSICYIRSVNLFDNK